MNNKFFHPYLTYNARIDANFKDTFSLRFDNESIDQNQQITIDDLVLLIAEPQENHVWFEQPDWSKATDKPDNP